MSDIRLLFIALAAAAFLIIALWSGWRLFFKGGTLRDAPSRSAPRPPQRIAARELLRVERDPADETVSIWFHGERVGHARMLDDARLREAVQVLLSAGAGPAADAEARAGILQPAPAEPHSPSAPVAAPDRGTVEPLADMPLDEDMRKPFLTRMRESMAKPRSYASPMTPISPGAGKDQDQPAWMFTRINDILQRMLSEQSGMPSIEISGEGSEIRIRLNSQTYTTLGDVPDERARELIRAAVAEWERT